MNNNKNEKGNYQRDKVREDSLTHSDEFSNYTKRDAVEPVTDTTAPPTKKTNNEK